MIWQQIRALLVKNWILQRRNIWSTLVQALIPVLIVSLIGVFQIIINNELARFNDQMQAQDFSPYYLGDITPKNGSLSGLPYFYFVVKNNKQSSDIGRRTIDGKLGGLLAQTQNISLPFYRFPIFKRFSTLTDLNFRLYEQHNYWRELLQDRDGIQPKLSKAQRKIALEIAQNALLSRNFTSLIPQGAFVFNDYQKKSGAGNFKADITLMPAGRYGGWFPSIDPKSGRMSIFQLAYPEADRIGSELNLINNALLRDFVRVNIQNSSSIPSIKTYYQGMPEKSAPSFDLGSVAGAYLLCFAVSFMLPVFVTNIVVDKEDKILMMMRMSGLDIKVYWLVSYVYNMLSYLLVFGLTWLTGFLFSMKVFTETSWVVILVSFLLWGNVLISLSFLLSTVFNSARSSSIVSYFLIIASVIVSNLLNATVFMNSTPPLWWFILWPPFAFYRLIFIISDACINLLCLTSRSLIDGTVNGARTANGSEDSLTLTSATQFSTILLIMLVQSVVMFVLSWYIYEILPKEYGVQRNWLFPFEGVFGWRSGSKLQTQQQSQSLPGSASVLIEEQSDIGGESDLLLMDEDVRRERDHVLNDGDSVESSLIINGLTKRYAGCEDVALKPFYLRMAKGEVFGLLGANGAAKTTLISCLTGLLQPSGGNAFYDNMQLDIVNDMVQIQKSIGVCMQFDVYYSKLSCEEHLIFFAGLKGVPQSQLKAKVSQVLDIVGLLSDRHKLAKQLSGGMRRRLSLAIALIGDPQVLFLDEPSSGLDIVTRRHLWEVFSLVYEARRASSDPLTVILTTHNIDEADRLCNRVGIMSHGQLNCIGAPDYLKQKFSVGHTLTLNVARLSSEQSSSGLSDFELADFVVEAVEGAICPHLSTHCNSALYSFTSRRFRYQMPIVSCGSILKVSIIPKTDIDGAQSIQWSSAMSLMAKAKESRLALKAGRELNFTILDYEITETSLQDVFIKVLKDVD
ncbi:hypothetical protein MIR68_007201 [Amoeboaphelidium protococcarum]|nr:hypothetical protein MIR68_007201 [Amoeboaphelidium protococcarum]